MDHQIVRDLFGNVIRASEILDVDEEFRSEVRIARDSLAPNRVGQYGQLQEWLEDKDDSLETHRHVSHLWALHPGTGINRFDTPGLYKAAERSLRFRGDGGTGWSMAWKINFWARLHDGDHAHRMLENLLTLTGSSKTEYDGGGVYPNLFDSHPPFQIDGNFGATSGIAEMLVQSYGDLIHFLPAVPSNWPIGRVTGLRARGQVTIEDMRWDMNDKIVELTLRSAVTQDMSLLVGKGVTDVQVSYAVAERESTLLENAPQVSLPENQSVTFLIRFD
jgi:alpha-L-fucosidase 2